MVLRGASPSTRRGVASVLAMLFLSLFTVLATTMAVMSTSSVHVAGRQHDSRLAYAAAESGLQFIHHQFASMTDLPATEAPEVEDDELPDLWQSLCQHFEALNGTANLDPGSVTTSETQISIPAIRLPVESGEAYSDFSVTITVYGGDPHYMEVIATGRYRDAVRRAKMMFKWGKDTSILTYGVASRSGIVIAHGSQVTGDLFSTWDCYAACPPYVLEADCTVDGTLYHHDTQEVWENENLYAELDGTYEGIGYEEPIFNDNFTADDFDTSKYKDPTTEIRPGVQVGVLVDLSTIPPDTTYSNHEFHTREHFNRPVYRNRTFDNIIIPKGYNPIFENCTFNRITYVDTDEELKRATVNWEDFNPELPTSYQTSTNTMPMKSYWRGHNSDWWTDAKTNNVVFEDCTFNGPVISAVPRDYFWTKNALHFSGETRFFNNYMPESTILTPNFNVNIGGFNSDSSDSKLSGIIVGGIVDIRGDAEVDGTILSMYYPDYDLGTSGRSYYRTNIGYYGDAEAGDLPPDTQGTVVVTPNPDRVLPFGIIGKIRIRPQYGSYSE
jgi:Tfp pilus assembly protein PilX